MIYKLNNGPVGIGEIKRTSVKIESGKAHVCLSVANESDALELYLTTEEMEYIFQRHFPHSLFASLKESLEKAESERNKYKEKAEKWDALEAKISKYCNGEDLKFNAENPYDSGDFMVFGEYLAEAFGRLE